jgi:hypothetical protein
MAWFAMRHRHDHFHHYPDLIEVKGGIAELRDLIIQNHEEIMATLAELNAAVARNTDAEDSVVTLLQGISQQLKDAKASNDPAAIDAVIAQLDANTAKAAAAVVENTPAA